MENTVINDKLQDAQAVTTAMNVKRMEVKLQEKGYLVVGFDATFDELASFITETIEWGADIIESMEEKATIYQKYWVALEIDRAWETDSCNKSSGFWALDISIAVFSCHAETDTLNCSNFGVLGNNPKLFEYFGIDLRQEITNHINEWAELINFDAKEKGYGVDLNFSLSEQE